MEIRFGRKSIDPNVARGVDPHPLCASDNGIDTKSQPVREASGADIYKATLKLAIDVASKQSHADFPCVGSPAEVQVPVESPSSNRQNNVPHAQRKRLSRIRRPNAHLVLR
jgi:hypothetical protein